MAGPVLPSHDHRFLSGTDEKPSRVTWTLEARGAATLLTVVHDELEGETSTYWSVAHGWVPILSGLKTLLETGQPIEISDAAAEGVRDRPASGRRRRRRAGSVI